MHINKIDNNPNFKMALKINPELKPEIVKEGADFLTKIDNYGKQISDIKFYDVVLDESIHTPKIYSCDKTKTKDFFAELKNEENNLGKWYEVPAGPEGDSAGGFMPNEPRVFINLYGKEAKEKYKNFKKLDSFAQAAEYSRMLEELDVKKMIAEKKEKSQKLINDLLKKEEQEKLSRVADDIIERYRYETPVKPAGTMQDKSTKKSWWQKFFA